MDQYEEAIEMLRVYRGTEDEPEYLWRTVIAFEGCSFRTLGRGKEHSGAIEFRYTVSFPSNTYSKRHPC